MTRLPPRSALLLAVLAVLVASGVPARAQFEPELHFPLEDGHFWDYRFVSSGLSGTGTIGVLFCDEVGDLRTCDLESSGPEIETTRERLRSGPDGLELLANEAEILGFLLELSYDPPILVGARGADVGSAIQRSGTVSVRIPGIGNFPLGYSSSTRVVRETTVDVPAGRFDVLETRIVLSVDGTIEIPPAPPERITFTTTDTNWLAPHLGLVKSIETQDDIPVLELELLDMAEPTVALVGDPESIELGGSTQLSWTSTLADECTAQDGWTGPRDPVASETVSPRTSTLYTLDCNGPGGTARASVLIAVPEATALAGHLVVLLGLTGLARRRR